MPSCRLTISALLGLADACTNFMVTPGASADGSTIFSYSSDGAPLNIMLDQDPATNETLNRFGLVNDHAVAIGETTFGGLPQLSGSGKWNYMDLMKMALQKATTAREMITVMDEIVKKDGYSESGESFTIGDQNEVWHMEVMAKGQHDKGWVWVAMRVPDGYVGGHANQARIRTFPLNDPETCKYSPDVIDFAIKMDLYPADAPKEEFSFADVYDPISFSGARKCDARVWYFFSQVGPKGFEKQYEDYAMGYNLTNRMPLFIKPVEKVNLTSYFRYFRHHYEGSALDATHDISAGPHHQYHRDGGSWKSGGKRYVNERPVGVEYATFHYTAQLRQGLPKPISALNWFAADDSSYSVYVPFHGCTTRVPRSFSEELAMQRPISFESSYWVNNLLANFVYYRHDQMAANVLRTIEDTEKGFMTAVAEEEEHAMALWPTNRSAAIEYLTNRAEVRANDHVKHWFDYYKELFMEHMDGRSARGEQRGYAQDWYDRVAEETGSRYLDMTSDAACEHNERKAQLLDSMSRGEKLVPRQAKVIL